MNLFDAAVYLCLFIAVVMGFNSGLLRSLVTIFGYIAAAPISAAAAPTLSQFFSERFGMAPTQNWLVLAGGFLVTGVALSALFRMGVDEAVGRRISVPDRLAGALLGAVRIGLLAVVMVLIFDRLIPPDRQPGFLVNSQLRPLLSAAGRQGLKALPPDVADFIDRVKRERGI